MPRVPDRLLRSCVYLYPSGKDAMAGTRASGTGFIVAVPSAAPGEASHLHIVTCRHVVDGDPDSGSCDPSPVVRVTARDGRNHFLHLTTDSWALSDGDDLAVTKEPFGASNLGIDAIGMSEFLDRETVHSLDVGPGDDIFIVGRFYGHEGKSRNLPSVRFGTISMMPVEKIRHPTIASIEQESFLADLYTVRGYSGSAVYLWREGGSSGTADIRLLGMYWMTFEDRQKLLTLDRSNLQRLSEYNPILFRNAVEVLEIFTSEGNAGLSGVLPAWRIAEAINSDDLRAKRAAADLRTKPEAKALGYLGVTWPSRLHLRPDDWVR